MEELIAAIARGLVEDKESVSVKADAPAEDGTIIYHLHVAEDDMESKGASPRLFEQLSERRLPKEK